MKKKKLIMQVLFTAVLLIGMFFPIDFVRAVESTDQTSEETTVSDEKKMNVVMYTKDKVKVMSGPGTQYDVITEFAAQTPVVITDQTDENWYEFYFQETVAYIKSDELEERAVDEALVQEMEAHAQNDVLEIESFVRQQKEAARAKVWGIIIAVLIVSIFALGIVTTLKASKATEEGKKKSGRKDNPAGVVQTAEKLGKESTNRLKNAISNKKEPSKRTDMKKSASKKPSDQDINVIDLDSGDDTVE